MKVSGGMEPVFVFSILGGIIILLLVVGAPVRSMRWIGQVLVKVVVGALFLFFVNAFGTSLGLHIPINLTTASISGLLGLPGVAALIIIKMVILS
ncbi:pro-sigmaK processing inhibitor BofA family protein [Metabacillus idriensis]|uniref:pro-sigmaK processing inhibitor BofA family protein n=1 Tax=Metabacillus idriensis TaxID=324768 RepID=UPI00296633DB|nr:pro-sigmaK processing inhibitor BofA family protein [Metabacillus idriensis]